MKEAFEIDAIRLARMVCDLPDDGLSVPLRQLARSVLAFSEQEDIPERAELPLPAKEKLAPIPVRMRWMIRYDMQEVLAIENQCFEFPWNEATFIKCLRQRNCIGVVCDHCECKVECDGCPVAGFMIYELHRSRLQILNFAVLPDYWGRGVGTAMVNKLKSKLSAERRTRIVLQVRETNTAALLFFKSLGFRATALLKDWYEDTTEDAVHMVCRYGAEVASG